MTRVGFIVAALMCFPLAGRTEEPIAPGADHTMLEVTPLKVPVTSTASIPPATEIAEPNDLWLRYTLAVFSGFMMMLLAFCTSCICACGSIAT